MNNSSEKIAVITGKDPTYPQDSDGATTFLRNYLRFLVQRGVQADIYTTNCYSGDAVSKGKMEHAGQEGEFSGMQVIRYAPPALALPTYKDDPKGLKFLNRAAISFAEASYFADGKLRDYVGVQILHTSHAIGLVLGDVVPQKRTTIFPMMLGEEYRRYMPVAENFIDLEREVFKQVGIIQAPSHDHANTLRQNYSVPPSKIVTTHRGYPQDILLPRERTLPQDRPVRILSANMVRPQKGQHILVPFAEECRKRKLPIKIVIAGVNGESYSSHYNEYHQIFLEEIRKRGLTDSFEFTGPKDHQELNELMLASDVSIVPSVFETFGKSALESMATGMPTIVFDDVPSFKEFMTHHETAMFAPRSPMRLADTFELLTHNKDLYEALSRNGIYHGRNFSWDRVLAQMVDGINTKLHENLSI